MELRLGDVIDDHCIKCRRLTNHSVVSIVDGQVAKVRCRSCYHEHSYLHEQAPPSRKDLKKAELAAKAEAEAAASADGETAVAQAEEPENAEPAVKSRTRKA
jgi:hypothetical protein